MTPLSLLDSAALLGRMRYVELGLFERLGRRARTLESAPAAVWLSGASLAHAFRSCLIEHHLPVSATLPGPAQLTVSPGPDLDAVLDLLEPAPGAVPGDLAPPGARLPEAPGGPALLPGPDAELVGALVGALYPAMLAGYERRLDMASPAADPPLARTLGRVVHDLLAVTGAGRRLLEGAGTASRPAAGTASPALAELVAGRLAEDGPFGTFGQDTGRRVTTKPS